MKNVIVGLVIGLIVGAGAGWLLTSATLLRTAEEKLTAEEALNKANSEQIESLSARYDALQERSETELTKLTDELAAKDSQISELKAQKHELAKAFENYRNATAQAPAKTASSEPASETHSPEDEDVKFLKEIMKVMKRVTPIGGPLNEMAVKELDLDENQVADINEALKEEGRRMYKRLVEWADSILKDKSAEELMKMTDLEISMAIMPQIQGELELLRKEKPENIKAVQLGKKHFVKMLPKDAKMTRIVKALYEERQKTYLDITSLLSQEQEKKLKDEYLQSGTFVFPGNAGYGMGQLTPEDFEE